MSVFESTVDDALGLWSNTPQSEAVAFGMGDESGPASDLVYRVNLPGRLADSDLVFESAEAAFARMDAALAEVPGRLDGLVERTRESLQKQASGPSFAVPSESRETGLEEDLLFQLADVERGAAPVRVVDGEISFGIGETFNAVWDASKKQFEALMTRIDQDVLHFAWVETTISGQLIARTSVDWSGDAQTVWVGGSGKDQSALHQRNLRFVTQTRGMRLRLFVTVASGAARVASLMLTPGGAVLALPAVYQYVTKILAQARELQSIQTP
jgi:hypothetical protein